MEKRENRVRHFFRIIRPLSWWVLLVLILYGLRLHQRLIETTRLTFKTFLNGQPIDAYVTFDGKPAWSGQKIPLGKHSFKITSLKSDPIATNVFIWYGGRDFGNINLRRSTGTLIVQSVPKAKWLLIDGPEFHKMLTNSPGESLLVPTDNYEIAARFAFSDYKYSAVVSSGSTSTVRIAPPLGSLHISSSHSNTTFVLEGKDKYLHITGDLPAEGSELPAGNYEITAERNGESQTRGVWIGAGKTNDIRFEFKYGAVTFETDPAGATVLDANGRERGTTPLTLQELHPGTSQFTLQRTDYDTVTATIGVTADETNHFRTNLVNAHFAAAMRDAETAFSWGRWNETAQSATEALKYAPGDINAIVLRRKAVGFSHLDRAKGFGERGDFQSGIAELNVAAESLPDNVEVKKLLADYAKSEEEQVAAEKKRQADLAEQERKRLEAEAAERKAQAKIQELHAAFEVLARGFEGSEQFSEHELVASNSTTVVGPAIKADLSDDQPSFQIIKFQAPRPDLFALQARQMVGIGYRDCIVAGEEVRDGETRIVFKVLEYDHPPDLKLLGGFLTATVRQDNHYGMRPEEFEEQKRQGVVIVEGRIRRAIGNKQ